MSTDPSISPSSQANIASVEKNPAALAWYEAVWRALRSKDLDFYPRIKGSSGSIISLDTISMMAEFNQAAKEWTKLKADELEDAINLARQSLDESKKQTEYQDQKATRLLTVTTFLTALSGVLFTRFNDTYPIEAFSGVPVCEAVLLFLGYSVFGLFLFTALTGAIVTFHATRTRFKYPKQESEAREEASPKSRLFYSGVISVTPKAWANTFVKPSTERTKPKLRNDIVQAYYRDLVGETYLVAAKTADKLRYLEPAQNLLSTSLKALLVWLLILPIISLSVNFERPTEAPLQVSVTIQDRPLRMEAVTAPALRNPEVSPTPEEVRVNNAKAPMAATSAGATSPDRGGHE